MEQSISNNSLNCWEAKSKDKPISNQAKASKQVLCFGRLNDYPVEVKFLIRSRAASEWQWERTP